jgi:hypothetical protein
MDKKFPAFAFCGFPIRFSLFDAFASHPDRTTTGLDVKNAHTECGKARRLTDCPS